MNLLIQLHDPRLSGQLGYATDGAAAIDLRACIEAPQPILPGDCKLIPLGFSMALPANHAAMLLPRSGLGAKEGIVIGNLIGLIDEDYRGQVMAAVWNRNSPRSLLAEPFLINPMDRIAQMVIVPVLRPTLQWVDTLPATQRGAGGFGSTGK